ncbi:MAG: methyltransferase domain-containing protein, partial [Flavobacteriales bacterium]|nr:methyltransferase domain-containing protein [Flavobacteriales bacterium]
MKKIKNNYSFIDKADTDEIYHRLDRRWNAKSPILKYAHRKKFEKLLKFIEPGQNILDIGRGGSVDGVLGVLAAQKGAKVTILNVSDRHIESIKRFAEKNDVLDKISFIIGNPQECEEFEDNSFDIVISLHVLEHLESTSEGLKTIHRLTNSRAIIALPTCLNPCVWIRFGKQNCYEA